MGWRKQVNRINCERFFMAKYFIILNVYFCLIINIPFVIVNILNFRIL